MAISPALVRTPSWLKRVFLPILIAVLATAVTPVSSANAGINATEFESCLLSSINSVRSSHGLGSVALATDKVAAARVHSAVMASEGGIRHTTTSERSKILPSGWSTFGENVGWASSPYLSSCAVVHNALMDSPGHKANIVRGSFGFVALGVVLDDDGTWVTQEFFSHSTYKPAGTAPLSPPPPPVDDPEPVKPPTWDGTFWDDDGMVFEGDIEKLFASGITAGCAADSFCPAGAVTRGQMAAFLVRALDLPKAKDMGFVDTADSVFKTDIDALAAAGISTGCSATRFCPNSDVTRGQLAAFLNRALDLPEAGWSGFMDSLDSVFRSDIDALHAAGITAGCAESLFCPDKVVTRSQMAAFLVRALDL